MRLIRLAAALAPIAGPAAAHGPGPVPPDALWTTWSLHPLVLVPLCIAHLLYGRGVLRLWTRAGRGRGIAPLQVLSFITGEAAVVVALVSPLDPLGGTLLSAHMAQHGLLIAVAPPLLLLGRPGAAFAWGVPHGWSRGAPGTIWRPLARLGRRLTRPVPAAGLHGLALWLWHAPAPFDAAVEHEWLHVLEHASFFGTGLLFWCAVLTPRTSRTAAPALGAAFATLIHGSFLSALITMSPALLYGWYAVRTELWGMSALADQQLAGLLMWVPIGVVYFGACLLLASRFLSSDAPHTTGAETGASRPSP